MKKLLLFSAAAFFITSPAAYADDGEHKDGGHKGGKMFERMDADKDGFVTKEEFMAEHEKHFLETDVNGDGKLTKEEIKTKMDEMRAKWKAEKEARKGDKDGDAAPAAPPEGEDAPPPPPVE